MFLRIAEKAAHTYCVVGMENDVEKSFLFRVPFSSEFQLASIDGNSSFDYFPQGFFIACTLPSNILSTVVIYTQRSISSKAH